MKSKADVYAGKPAWGCKHGGAALAAVVAACVLLMAVQREVERVLPGRMADFAARPSPVKLTGNVLQTEAFRLPETLPIYGSSELDRPAANRPDEFFRARPTGFSVFPVGRGGTTCLMIVQKVAAVGVNAHGKKAVIFLSPSWFAREGVGENAVEANLTPPQLGAWLFESVLSAPLRERIARRLLDYPESLQEEMLLGEAVRCVANPTPASRLAFALLKPFGYLQNALASRIEYSAILREMAVRSMPGERKITQVIRTQVGEPDWPHMAAEAEAADRAHDDGAVYSATNDLLPVSRRGQNIRAQTPGSRDAEFAAKVLDSKEFDDLQLLVDVLRELDVDALFISQPFNGIYRDLGGTTRRGRRVYYDKLAAILARTGYSLLDFSDHEEDRFFFNDAGHPSAKAWIFYDQGINRFYHGTPWIIVHPPRNPIPRRRRPLARRANLRRQTNGSKT